MGVVLERLERPLVVTDTGCLEANRGGGVAVETLARRVVSVDGATAHPGVVALDDLRGAASPPASPRQEGEAVLITHTSGTTGVPKLVQHSVDTISAVVSFETRKWPVAHLRSDDVCGICLSYVHLRSVTGWATVLHTTPSLVALSEPDTGQVERLFGEHQPTVVETHPNIYMTWEGLAGNAISPFADTRLFISTFDAIHPRTVRTLLDASHRRFPIWAQGWGQSEIGPATVRIYTRRSLRAAGVARRSPATSAPPFPSRPRCGSPIRRPAGRSDASGSVWWRWPRRAGASPTSVKTSATSRNVDRSGGTVVTWASGRDEVPCASWIVRST